MPHLPNPPPDPAWIDELLREDAARDRVIADDGFSARVLGQLPVRRVDRPYGAYRWIAPVFGATAVAAVLSFSPALGDLLAPARELLLGATPKLRELVPMLALASAVYVSLWFGLNEPR